MDSTSEALNPPSCPKCGSPLVQENAPFYVRGQYLGDFESVVCKTNSDYTALTELGFIDASIMAEERHLIGPAEEVDDEDKELREQNKDDLETIKKSLELILDLRISSRSH